MIKTPAGPTVQVLEQENFARGRRCATDSRLAVHGGQAGGRQKSREQGGKSSSTQAQGRNREAGEAGTRHARRHQRQQAGSTRRQGQEGAEEDDIPTSSALSNAPDGLSAFMSVDDRWNSAGVDSLISGSKSAEVALQQDCEKNGIDRIWKRMLRTRLRDETVNGLHKLGAHPQCM